MKRYILVRYGELSTKGRNKKRFTQQLAQNIKGVLADLTPNKVVAGHDYLTVYPPAESVDIALERLSHVFGIQSYSPVIELEKDMEVIRDQIFAILDGKDLKGKSFRIATKRADHDFYLDTNAINRYLGEAVAERYKELRVQLKRPDLVIKVEIREKYALLTTEVYKGAGGLPVGTSGRALLLLSGGIDSVVAGYMALKRGIEVEAVHFASPPYTSPQALQKAKDLAKILARYGRQIQFLTVPFTASQEAIKQNLPSPYLMTITRRMMMRVASRLAEERKALAIVTGESIGQVASQTLESMLAITDAAGYPVLRPLAGFDKLEIIALAEEIGSFELSIQPYEDCCTVFAPPSPKTKPKLEACQHYETKIDVKRLVEDAVKHTEVENISAHEINEFNDLL
ncbi:tRNA 4-thiouridine(8) synthase ThiI [Atopobacter sp. AH10]|uniref:tRNA uracil 4-sulfurtransferase ThiI n=1 Tax=Atopobacter sp. AH10 TaxID=2315861 RepID=UPI000EF25DE8|nr:tRNA uracil 4-sulfurtransferase ThiI [Atopobacter sp. AH10]RLK62962.1 tRNA 4-thiouridine(8) synthase ThiI [Atopobacter sp. AH10]